MPNYNSVAEIFEAMDGTRERLRQTLEDLSAEQTDFREAADRWTIAEIAEHLAIVNGQIVRLLGRVVGKAEEDGAPRAPEDGRIDSVALSALAERAAGEKFNAPETALPKGGANVSDSLTRLEESRAALQLLRPRIEALDLSAYKFPHPAFGPIDPYHWLAVLNLHEERHRRQIEGLKAAAGGA